MRNKNIAIIFLVLLVSSGCIRLVGTAGYTHQGANDEESKTKQVTLDTNRLVPQT